jgi:2-polyprenyl-3-methyl-5-hydroxy-6-metoxy-1,4-benzoquinol methylase
MPTIEENQQTWDGNYEWSKQGDEWSSSWGSADAQWFESIFPRIHNFLPTGTILEIAPGFGRWTNYLKNAGDRLIVVDLSEKCIKACQQRFAADTQIEYHVNDGKSLAMIPDGSIDFVFSFDSLVHAEADVLETYLSQLATKLKPNGVGFIHHSNLGQYQSALSLIEQIPNEMRAEIVNKNLLEPTRWRAGSMTAKLFANYCDRSGLQCIGQELVNWENEGLLIDSFSLFTPKNSTWSRNNHVIENLGFMQEAAVTKKRSQVYSIEGKQVGS